VPADELATSRAASEQTGIHHVETGITRADGQVVWTDLSVVPVALPDWKLIVVTFDLSAARRSSGEAQQATAAGDGEKG
jgi:hypothetical protein